LVEKQSLKIESGDRTKKFTDIVLHKDELGPNLLVTIQFLFCCYLKV